VNKERKNNEWNNEVYIKQIDNSLEKCEIAQLLGKEHFLGNKRSFFDGLAPPNYLLMVVY
jgi:hypothetical protein